LDEGQESLYDGTMDNICHTLVGALCGEAGLKHRSRLGNATLMIAANLPDIDVAVFATDIPSVAFRRGVTHGVLAQVLLPPLLAVLMWVIARGRADRADRAAPHLGWLIGLSYIGVFSHVGLDLLNSYGIRLLMPWSGRWFYGDTLFIIDPWMWAVLGVGVWLARRSQTVRPARMAMVVAAVYLMVMVGGARLARRIVLETWQADRGTVPVAMMVGPRPIQPFSREVIIDAGDYYTTGNFSWLPPMVQFDREPVLKRQLDPAVRVARDTPEIRAFLVWSRFPVWTVSAQPDGIRVRVTDLRFSGGRRLLGRAGFAAEATVSPGDRPVD
jgi:inner membrane protein